MRLEEEQLGGLDRSEGALDPGARRQAASTDHAGMGHRLFDLGNLAVNNGFDDAAEERLLAAYFDDSPPPGRRAALKLMRIMSDAREAAWGVAVLALAVMRSRKRMA